VGVGVHGGDTGIVLLSDEITMLRQARGPLEHVHARVLLLVGLHGRLVLGKTMVFMGAT